MVKIPGKTRLQKLAVLSGGLALVALIIAFVAQSQRDNGVAWAMIYSLFALVFQLSGLACVVFILLGFLLKKPTDE